MMNAGRKSFGKERAIRYPITSINGSRINLLTQCSCPGMSWWNHGIICPCSRYISRASRKYATIKTLWISNWCRSGWTIASRLICFLTFLGSFFMYGHRTSLNSPAIKVCNLLTFLWLIRWTPNHTITPNNKWKRLRKSNHVSAEKIISHIKNC